MNQLEDNIVENVSKTDIETLLQGVIQYNKTLKNELVPYFRDILDKPAPKSILISCIDSRLLVSRVLQSQPGDYFQSRNPGNFIPKFECLETSIPASTASSLELACIHNNANTVKKLFYLNYKYFTVNDRTM